MCEYPNIAYRSAEIGESGKRALVFDKRLSHTGIPINLPCGQCVMCRLERSRQWAMRCLHEKSLYRESCFVTLTYEDQNIPLLSGPCVKDRQTLSLRDVQLFMKRLRKQMGEGIRFYLCGEYGCVSSRPHYHVLLFNRDFHDKKHFKDTRAGDRLFTSKSLDNVWGNGLAVFGDVTFESCAYVARYVVDKITGDMAEVHYGGRLPEFATRSMRPGIGAGWFDRYGDHAYKHDSVVMRGSLMKPPKYYLARMEAIDPSRVSRLKQRRNLLRFRDKLGRWYERTDRDRARAREAFELKKQAFFAKKGV